MNAKDLEEALEMGMDWSLREGYVWAEDKVRVRLTLVSEPASQNLSSCPIVGALRGIRPHVERRPHVRFHESQEAGSTATGHPGGRQPLRGDTGGRRDLRQVRRRTDGHRPQGPSRGHGALRVEGLRTPGRDRRPRVDGEGDEEGQHRGQRPAAGVRAHRLQGGPGVPEGDGVRGQLCVGQQELYDVSHQASVRKGEGGRGVLAAAAPGSHSNSHFPPIRCSTRIRTTSICT